MPLNPKGRKIKRAMMNHYGPDKGKQVFYASENAGTIKNVTRSRSISGAVKAHHKKHRKRHA